MYVYTYTHIRTHVIYLVVDIYTYINMEIHTQILLDQVPTFGSFRRCTNGGTWSGDHPLDPGVQANSHKLLARAPLKGV